MISAALLIALAATSFNSPSGTLIVNLKAPVEKGWVVGKTPPWSVEISDLKGSKWDTVEFHSNLPGMVLESEDKVEGGVSFSYKMTARFCLADFSVCKNKVFKGRFP